MQLLYGSYAHAENEATVSIQSSRVLNDAEQSIETRTVWSIQGQLHADSQAELITAIALLEAAYAVDYYDLVLLDNSGNVAHALRNAGSTTGVRITQPPSYPDGRGAEFSTYRTYTIVAEASYRIVPPDGQSALVSFSETVSIRGGGPVYAMVETVEGPAERQRIRNFSACRATQSGQAVGLFDYPPVPAPLFPDFLTEDPVISRTGPDKTGPNTLENYKVSWEYQFASPSQLFALPNVWV